MLEKGIGDVLLQDIESFGKLRVALQLGPNKASRHVSGSQSYIWCLELYEKKLTGLYGVAVDTPSSWR